MEIIKQNNIIHITQYTQFELNSTFMRIQEFYESPYVEIKDKYFTMDTMMTVYAICNKDCKFTYFTDWAGFNIPGHIVLKFFRTFWFDLRKKEIQILKCLTLKQLLGLEKFYIIGTQIKDDRTIVHETAHALYYLNDSYRKEMDFLISEMSHERKAKWYDWLLKKQYCEEVLDDEIQAYSVERNIKSFGKVYDYYVD